MIVRTKKALNFYISNAKQYHQRIPHSNGQSSLPSLFQYSTNTENSNTSMQSLAVVTHPSLLLHDIPGHPESPSRLKTILDAISNPKLMADQELCSHIHIFDDPPQITRSVVALAHPPSYVDYILDIAEQSLETNKIISLDSDTALCPHSMSALMFAPASVTYCIDLVLSSSFNNETIEDMTAHHPITGLPSHFRHTFAAIRPPGHHAEYEKSMGFCIFNNIFIGAKYAQLKFAELENNHQSKIAIIDFDVHHGNGTQQLCWDEPDIMYISCHQFGDYFFPGTGDRNETGAYQNIINIPIERGSDGQQVRKMCVEYEMFDKLMQFNPDLVMISAGFDAHSADPLAQLHFNECDFEWFTAKLVEVAQKCSNDRIVSVLEGGYDLTSLETSVMAHFRRLCSLEAKKYK